MIFGGVRIGFTYTDSAFFAWGILAVSVCDEKMNFYSYIHQKSCANAVYNI